jgi:SAM-dependent methyltransferase
MIQKKGGKSEWLGCLKAGAIALELMRMFESAYALPFRRPAVLRIVNSELAAVACPLCASYGSQKAFEDNGHTLRSCKRCGLFFVAPYPRNRLLSGPVPFGQNRDVALSDCRRQYQREVLFYRRYFPAIARHCRNATSILDVSCGTGHLLERLSMCSSSYRLGIQVDPLTARFARCVAGCPVIETPFQEFRGATKFDVITMIDVFSRVTSFDATFRSLRGALAPDGRVLVRNLEMAHNVSRWNQLDWNIPADLQFLGLRTLDMLSAKYGFTVVDRTRTPYEQELFLPARWKQMGELSPMNLTKRICGTIPGIVPALKGIYSAAFGGRIFSSLSVLKVLPSSVDSGEHAASRTAPSIYAS